MFDPKSHEWQIVTDANELAAVLGLMIEFEIGLPGCPSTTALITQPPRPASLGEGEGVYVSGVAALHADGTGHGHATVSDRHVRQAREVGKEGLRVRVLPPAEAARVRLSYRHPNPFDPADAHLIVTREQSTALLWLQRHQPVGEDAFPPHVAPHVAELERRTLIGSRQSMAATVQKMARGHRPAQVARVYELTPAGVRALTARTS
jgi:hypothetical protein